MRRGRARPRALFTLIYSRHCTHKCREQEGEASARSITSQSTLRYTQRVSSCCNCFSYSKSAPRHCTPLCKKSDSIPRSNNNEKSQVTVTTYVRKKVMGKYVTLPLCLEGRISPTSSQRWLSLYLHTSLTSLPHATLLQAESGPQHIEDVNRRPGREFNSCGYILSRCVQSMLNTS